MVESGLAIPLANRLVRDLDCSVGREILHLAETQRESVVQPHPVADDLRGESVSTVDRLRVGQHGSRRAFDGILTACYWHPMANLQVKDVPEPLHRKIRAYARRRGRTVRDVVLAAVAREIDEDAFLDRLAKREPVNLGRPAARVLEEVRRERQKDLGE